MREVLRRAVKIVGRMDRDDPAPAPTAAGGLFRAWWARPRDAAMPGQGFSREAPHVER